MNKTIVILLLLLALAAFPLTGRAESLPEAAYIPGVIGHAQSYSLSCESRSAVDWAAYWGVKIRESEFLMTLPRSDDPDAGFVGEPNDVWGRIPPHSYGVHAKPVAALLRDYGLQAEAHRKLKWNDLRAEVAAGRPVIVWVIGQMWAGTPVDYTASSGHTATVAAFEHTMLLVGYTPEFVQVIDAYSGQPQTYLVETFLKSWKVLGNMAVLGYAEKPAVQPPPLKEGGTYIVQPGEYLTQLAGRFGTTWQELARLNHISFPYTIYAGQELKLPPKAEPAPRQRANRPGKDSTQAVYWYWLPVLTGGGGLHIAPQLAGETPATYTVQPGDSLMALAQRFHINWLELAALNEIGYPFIIVPGEIIRLK